MNAILPPLINSAIVSALVTLAVWVGMRMARRRLNAATRYLVWWTVLVIVVFSPLWYLPAGLRSRAVTAPSQSVGLTPIRPREIKGSAKPAPSAVVANRAAPGRLPFFPVKIAAGSMPQWLGAAWAVTCVLMLLRLVLSWVVLRRRKAHADEAPPSLSGRLDGWLMQCGSPRRRVRIAVSAEIKTPMLAGLLHPSVLFPANLLKALDEAELDQIGLHEVAHVARGDDLALTVQRIIEALLALHPVVRWLACRIDLEREIACDDFVVQAAGNPRPYAACLTHVAELTGGVRGSVIAAAAADRRSHLTRRVDMLLDRSRHTGTRPLKVRLAAGVAAIASVTWVSRNTPRIIAFAMPMSAEVAPAASVAGAPPLGAAALSLPLARVNPAPQASPRPSALPVNRTVGAKVVTIPVVVREPRNRVVTGLDKSEFRLFENGVEQEITQFRTGDAALSVGLVINTSSSTGAKFAQVNESIRQSVSAAKPLDEFFVVEFDQEARLAVGFSGNRDGVQPQPAQALPHGGTGLFDAVGLGMRQMRVAHNSRKAILVVTQTGSDDSSNPSEGQRSEELKLIAEFVQSSVPVYAFGNDPPARFLAELTEQTGGRYFAVGDDAVAVAESAARIGVGLRNPYELEYTPSNTAHDGAYRTVKVELIAPPGMPPLKLDYQPGYYEPRR